LYLYYEVIVPLLWSDCTFIMKWLYLYYEVIAPLLWSDCTFIMKWLYLYYEVIVPLKCCYDKGTGTSYVVILRWTLGLEKKHHLTKQERINLKEVSSYKVKNGKQINMV